LVESESDLLDSISDVFATHDNARVIGAEKTRRGLSVVRLVDVLAFGFKAGPYDIILMGLVTVFTLSSVSLYLVEWLRHMSTIEAK
jgi:hypothetical protein